MLEIQTNGLTIGIILVNFNGFEDTIECLRSLEAVTYENKKIYVVDNASIVKPSEAQLEYIKAQSVYIPSKENLGFSGGNNLGISKAIEDGCGFVLLLNNDTTVEKGFLEPLMEAANQNHKLGCVIGRIMFYSDPKIVWYAGGVYNEKTAQVCHSGWGKDYSEIELTDQSRDVTFATGCMMLIPADVIRKVGMLSEEYFLYAEDTDYCCRILKAGLRIFYCKDSVIYHKISRSTGELSSNTQYYMLRNNLIIIRKYGENKAYAYYKLLRQVAGDIVKRGKSMKIAIEAISAFVVSKKGKR